MNDPTVDGCTTIPQLFRKQCLARGNATAMREKDFGIWRSISWAEYGDRARRVGVALSYAAMLAIVAFAIFLLIKQVNRFRLTDLIKEKKDEERKKDNNQKNKDDKKTKRKKNNKSTNE